MPKGKALIDAIRALPKEAFADAMPPTTVKDWEDAELFIPLSKVPGVRKSPRRSKSEAKHPAQSEPVKPRKAKRA